MTSAKYAVIGHPISHSKSPLIHTMFAAANGQSMEYTAIEAPLDGFEETVRAFRAIGGQGMNVTVPFKVQAVDLCSVLTERAKLAGAVNTLTFDGDDCIAGDNFDGIGLVADLEVNLGASMRDKRVLLLGAGGSVRGALLPFIARGPEELVIANRSAEKAALLVAGIDAPAHVRGGGYDDIGAEPFDIVINATSASLNGELPPITARVFAPDCLAYDLLYGRGLTPFLRLAEQAGVRRLADGVGMLVEQAAEAFALWRGVRPATRSVIDALTVPLV